jgi:hypothetical protein
MEQVMEQAWKEQAYSIPKNGTSDGTSMEGTSVFTG